MRKSFFTFLIMVFAATSYAAEQTPVELQNVGIDEQLGEYISLDLKFRDEHNQEVTLADFFKAHRPTIISLVYYGCPNLCTLVLDGKTAALKNLPWDLGEKFNALSISINPAETTELALQKKQAYLAELSKAGAQAHWHFLTGTETNIKQLAAELGFRYYYDVEQKEFAHASALFILTPEGKISRYLYGIHYEPRDLKLALLEASSGKIGNVIDKFLLYCYHYDPKGRRYLLAATTAMKLGGGIAIIGIGGLIFQLKRRKRTKAC